jgi:hypothetical protein
MPRRANGPAPLHRRPVAGFSRPARQCRPAIRAALAALQMAA